MSTTMDLPAPSSHSALSVPSAVAAIAAEAETTAAAAAPEVPPRLRLLTPEQRSIVMHRLVDGDKVIVNAFAGTGKTTTLRCIIEYERYLRTAGESKHERPALYLAFNRSVVHETSTLFAKSGLTDLVECRTLHAMARDFARECLGGRRIDMVSESSTDANTVESAGNEGAVPADDDPDGIPYMPSASPLLPRSYDGPRTRAGRTLRRYWYDPSDAGMETEPQLEHAADGITICCADTELERSCRVPTRPSDCWCKRRKTTRDRDLCRRVGKHVTLRRRYEVALDQARSQWKRMQQADDRSPWPFEAPVKLLASHPAAAEAYFARRYTSVLIDEAQDINAVFIRALLSLQRVPLALIGDTYQSIYRFAGASDAISHAKERAGDHLRQYNLTCSFRFGARIAAAATSVLHRTQLLAPDVRIVAHEGMGHILPPPRALPTVSTAAASLHESRGAARPSVAAAMSAAPKTFIARTNRTAMVQAVEWRVAGVPHVRMLGRVANMVNRAVVFLEDEAQTASGAEQLLAGLVRRASVAGLAGPAANPLTNAGQGEAAQPESDGGESLDDSDGGDTTETDDMDDDDDEDDERSDEESISCLHQSRGHVLCAQRVLHATVRQKRTYASRALFVHHPRLMRHMLQVMTSKQHKRRALEREAAATDGEEGGQVSAATTRSNPVVSSAPAFSLQTWGTGTDDPSVRPLSAQEQYHQWLLELSERFGFDVFLNALRSLVQDEVERAEAAAAASAAHETTAPEPEMPTVCVAHTAKGLEWTYVILAGDFPCYPRLEWALRQRALPAADRMMYEVAFPQDRCSCGEHRCSVSRAVRLLHDAGLKPLPNTVVPPKPNPVREAAAFGCIEEEVHLLYVAMTRAKRVLETNASLWNTIYHFSGPLMPSAAAASAAAPIATAAAAEDAHPSASGGSETTLE